MPNTASAAQVNLLTTLTTERELDTLTAAVVENARSAYRVGRLDSKRASAAIKACFACPRKTATARPKTDIAPGLYFADGEVYKVQQGRNGLYALQLIVPGEGQRGTFRYAPGAYRRVADRAVPMTREQAVAFGARWSVCACCGHVLEDDISKAYFIGPVCEEKLTGKPRSRGKAAYAAARAVLANRAATAREQVASATCGGCENCDGEDACTRTLATV